MSCGVNDWDSQFTIRWEATKEALTTQRCHYITFQINKDILVHLSSTIITITFCNINTWDLSTTRFTLDTSMPIFLARYGQYHLIWMYKLEVLCRKLFFPRFVLCLGRFFFLYAQLILYANNTELMFLCI